MATEQADYVGELDQAKPAGPESLGEADDHLRLVKRCITNSLVGEDSDYWDAPLTVGPRYLSSLKTAFAPDTYVKNTGDEDIAGIKTFTGYIRITDRIIDEDSAGILGATDNGATGPANFVGNFNKELAAVSSAEDDLYHFYGDELAPTSAKVLTETNIVSLVLDKVFHVGFIIYTEKAEFNPNTDPFYPGTWEETAQGRAVTGYGTPTPDENGHIDPTQPTRKAGDEFGKWGSEIYDSNLPEHNHYMRHSDRNKGYDGTEERVYNPWTDRANYDGPADDPNPPSNPNNVDDFNGTLAGADERLPVTQPSQVAHIWKRVS